MAWHDGTSAGSTTRFAAAMPEGDQVRDRDERQSVLVGERSQSGQACHFTVLCADLADHRSLGDARQATQVGAGLGVSIPPHDPIAAGRKWEDVARSREVARAACGIGERRDRACPIRS